jgi:hypothetical protein
MADGSMNTSRIRKVTSRTFVLVLVFACIACVSAQSVVDYAVQKWVGQNFDQFVLRNGQPSRKFELKSGDVAYVWSSGTAFLSVPTTGIRNVYGNTVDSHGDGGGKIEIFCEMQIVTDRIGIIRELIILKDTIGLSSTSRCHEIL